MGQASQVPLLSWKPAGQVRQAPVLALQVEQPVQVAQAVVPPVVKVLVGQAVQVTDAFTCWNPAGQAVQSPVVAVQAEQVVQSEQRSWLASE